MLENYSTGEPHMSILDGWAYLRLIYKWHGCPGSCKSSGSDTTVAANDSNTSCAASLGLGNTARTEILEGDVWGAPKNCHHRWRQ